MDNGHCALKPTDLVFGNPMTDAPYVYSYLGNFFRPLLKQLELEGKGYTIRSSRGFCVTRLLSLGHPPYLISNNLGHSVDVMSKNYEQLIEDDKLAKIYNKCPSSKFKLRASLNGSV